MCQATWSRGRERDCVVMSVNRSGAPSVAVRVMGSSRNRAANTATVSGCVSMMIEESPALVCWRPLALKAWNIVPSTRPKRATAAHAPASRGSAARREPATPQRMTPATSRRVTATKSGEVSGRTSFVETIAVPQRAKGRTSRPRPRRLSRPAEDDPRPGEDGPVGWEDRAAGPTAVEASTSAERVVEWPAGGTPEDARFVFCIQQDAHDRKLGLPGRRASCGWRNKTVNWEASPVSSALPRGPTQSHMA